MKITMIIPTYWTRAASSPAGEGDVSYDHPTPLDSPGTLARTIASLGVLEDSNFQLVIVAAPAAANIDTAMEIKLAGIIERAAGVSRVETFLFGPSRLREIQQLLGRAGNEEYIDLLSLSGYSNVRNLGNFISHIMDADLAVLIDDDEMFEDPGFIRKTREFMGETAGGRTVAAKAGYYLQENGSYRVEKNFFPWMEHWDQFARMNEAFDRIIGGQGTSRLKETPFVFGGNMIIHRDLFNIPFDPGVPRGEDIDWLINARMFGHTVFLDNQLAIKHLPPPRLAQHWMQIRLDMERFLYERRKLECQRSVPGMAEVAAGDLDPYPGAFLKFDLEEKFAKASRLMADHYRRQGDARGHEESLKNIELAATHPFRDIDPFAHLCRLQRRWRQLLELTGRAGMQSKIRNIIRAGHTGSVTGGKSTP